jgi:hypothetical protein
MPQFVKRMSDNGATGYPVTMEVGRRAFNLRLAACRRAPPAIATSGLGKTRAL